jgi:hypothetical protein
MAGARQEAGWPDWHKNLVLMLHFARHRVRG